MRRGLLIALAALLFPSMAHAATLFLSPSAGTFGENRTFTVTVRVNTQGTAINAAEGVLSFDPRQLQVVSVGTNGSLFTVNVQPPEFSNTNGTVRFAGIIVNPGYTGGSGNLVTVVFKGITTGSAKVSFASGAVLANDGLGTNVTSGLSGGTYSIGPGAPRPTPDGSSPSSGGPEVSSTTHPDGAQWYANNDPRFVWNLPTDVDGVSYLVNAKPTANPGNASDGVVSTVEFSDLGEGASYFHAKFLRDGTWGPVTHFPFNIDTGAPAGFAITRTDGDDPTNPRPLLAYEATDAVSGVVKYLMRIGRGDWFEVPAAPADKPFAMPLQAPGSYEVLVEAVDRAGNSTRASSQVTVASIARPTIERWPEQVPSGDAFSVAGTAVSSTRVLLTVVPLTGPFGRVLFSDDSVTTATTTSDAAGRWEAAVKPLPDGAYRLEARAVDGRSAISDASDAEHTRVGYSLGWRFWDFLRSLWSWLNFAWLVLVGALILLLIAFLRRRRDAAPTAAISRSPKKVVSKLEELKADIDDEVALLDRLAEHRPLYPEEKYLKSKLSEYRKSVKFLLEDSHSKLRARKRKA